MDDDVETCYEGAGTCIEDRLCHSMLTLAVFKDECKNGKTCCLTHCGKFGQCRSEAHCPFPVVGDEDCNGRGKCCRGPLY
ncbi:CLUMA_CG019619, isoform A [Clunio marinus]|uniref:CLUMA_CG019619, isoform A n=1 Tax=Clunio marinus TaxID=568069 RepID=A0A1J1J7I1_9DIPT|nr:CLUMA_CG019619, isoform A [Clunio marinus]